VMKKIKTKMAELLSNNRGNMFPLTVAVAISLLMMLLVACEYMKLMIVSAGVKDAYEEAIISVVNDNYNEVYHCVREGYAGGYQPGGTGFVASLDQGNVVDRMSSLLRLEESGGGICISRTGAGNIQYRISNMNVTVHNTPMSRSGEKFYADGTLLLEIPVIFAGQTLGYMPVNIKVQATLREVF